MHKPVCSIAFPSHLTAARSAADSLPASCVHTRWLSPTNGRTRSAALPAVPLPDWYSSRRSARARSLQYHAEVFTDHCRIGAGELQCGCNSHSVQFFGNASADSPDLLNGLAGQHLLSPDVRRDGQHTTKLGHSLLLHWADFASVLVLPIPTPTVRPVCSRTLRRLRGQTSRSPCKNRFRVRPETSHQSNTVPREVTEPLKRSLPCSTSRRLCGMQFKNKKNQLPFLWSLFSEQELFSLELPQYAYWQGEVEGVRHSRKIDFPARI